MQDRICQAAVNSSLSLFIFFLLLTGFDFGSHFECQERGSRCITDAVTWTQKTRVVAKPWPSALVLTDEVHMYRVTIYESTWLPP